MNTDVLKQSELFVLLAIVFLLIAVFKDGLTSERVPPIISLSEDDKRFRFAVGSGDLSIDFKEGLQNDIFPLVDSLAERYQCNAIQVIGHTDGIRVTNRKETNIDEELVANVNQNGQPLIPNSNVDLGMMRAISVMNYFRQNQDTASKVNYFFPYSAGQVILENGELVGDADEDIKKYKSTRRRIEIRLFRFEKENKIDEINSETITKQDPLNILDNNEWLKIHPFPMKLKLNELPDNAFYGTFKEYSLNRHVLLNLKLDKNILSGYLSYFWFNKQESLIIESKRYEITGSYDAQKFDIDRFVLKNHNNIELTKIYAPRSLKLECINCNEISMPKIYSAILNEGLYPARKIEMRMRLIEPSTN